MAAEETAQQANPNGGFAALWRFLPMLLPKGETERQARVGAAVAQQEGGQCQDQHRTGDPARLRQQALRTLRILGRGVALAFGPGMAMEGFRFSWTDG